MHESPVTVTLETFRHSISTMGGIIIFIVFVVSSPKENRTKLKK